MAVQYKPERYNTVTPFLAVKDARSQVDYLKKAFDAEVVYIMEDDDGTVHHAELKLFGTLIMIGQPDNPAEAHGSSLYMYVEDTDAVYQRALAAGGTNLREPMTAFYGDRNAAVRDANGNNWWMATHVEDVSDDEITRRMQEGAKG